MAKAACWTATDAEARKRGEQTGLDTLVVHAVNDVVRYSEPVESNGTNTSQAASPGKNENQSETSKPTDHGTE